MINILKRLFKDAPNKLSKPKNHTKRADKVEWILHIGNNILTFTREKDATKVLNDIKELSRSKPIISFTKRGYYGEYMTEEVIIE